MTRVGSSGDNPKIWSNKLDIVPEEEEEQVALKLQVQIEEEYRLYIGQLSPEESDTDLEIDGSDYPCLD